MSPPVATLALPGKEAVNHGDDQGDQRQARGALPRGRNLEALDTLYGPDVLSVEAQGNEQMPAVMERLPAVRGRNEWWLAHNEVHRAGVKGPFPNEDRFAVIFDYEVTAKDGPMAGQRMQMEEVVYTVKDGKIVREEFFYWLG